MEDIAAHEERPELEVEVPLNFEGGGFEELQGLGLLDLLDDLGGGRDLVNKSTGHHRVGVGEGAALRVLVKDDNAVAALDGCVLEMVGIHAGAA